MILQEWLMLIEDEDIRDKALRYSEKELDFENCDSISQAIGTGFVWEETIEGIAFWLNIQNQYEL